jgi:hypothetical protein
MTIKFCVGASGRPNFESEDLRSRAWRRRPLPILICGECDTNVKAETSPERFTYAVRPKNNQIFPQDQKVPWVMTKGFGEWKPWRRDTSTSTISWIARGLRHETELRANHWTGRSTKRARISVGKTFFEIETRDLRVKINQRKKKVSKCDSTCAVTSDRCPPNDDVYVIGVNCGTFCAKSLS